MILGALVLALGSCASEGEPAPQVVGDEALGGAFAVALPMTDPAEGYDRLEEVLLAADEVAIDFHIESTGLLVVALDGSLAIDPRSGTRFVASGSFGGQPVELAVASTRDGGAVVTANGTSRQFPDMPRLNEAILIGLTRMGFLHNIARMTGLVPPDGARGGFAARSSALCFESVDDDTFAFKLFSEGRYAADVIIDLGRDGRPIRRQQTVHFEAGDMGVVEIYRSWRVVLPEPRD